MLPASKTNLRGRLRRFHRSILAVDNKYLADGSRLLFELFRDCPQKQLNFGVYTNYGTDTRGTFRVCLDNYFSRGCDGYFDDRQATVTYCS